MQNACNCFCRWDEHSSVWQRLRSTVQAQLLLVFNQFKFLHNVRGLLTERLLLQCTRLLPTFIRIGDCLVHPVVLRSRHGRSAFLQLVQPHL